ncbi:MAG: J domain-containing protein [Pirellulaceae bacterium]|nr:J domain-containing protein [Pirellulaceae bacterium]
MAEDYYSTLGLRRGASVDEIQKAYRDQARKYHPDLNPDDNSAKEKFQAIQNAYEVLSDPKKREMYDHYGSDYEQFSGGQAGHPGRGSRSSRGGPSFEDIDLSQFFGEQAGGRAGGGFADMFRQFTGKPSERQRQPEHGANIRHELQVPFRTAASGGDAQLSIRRQSGKIETLQVKIPAGIEHGKTIRLRGQGEPAAGGGTPGDLLITVNVAPHPFYQRNGNDLIARVPVKLSEAVLGGKVDVPTPKGIITLTVPAGSSSGKRLRVRGHGIASKNATGDLYAELQIVLPESIDQLDDETKEALSRVEDAYASDPRSELIW